MIKTILTTSGEEICRGRSTNHTSSNSGTYYAKFIDIIIKQLNSVRAIVWIWMFRALFHRHIVRLRYFIRKDYLHLARIFETSLIRELPPVVRSWSKSRLVPPCRSARPHRYMRTVHSFVQRSWSSSQNIVRSAAPIFSIFTSGTTLDSLVDILDHFTLSCCNTS